MRRGACAVLVSSAVLAPLVWAAISVAGRRIHSDQRIWLLAIALAAVSALALVVAALSAVRSLTLSGFGAPSLPLPLSPRTFAGKRADLAKEGEVLLQRAQENRRRAVHGIGPLVVARRSLAIATIMLVLAGALALVAAAL